MGNWVGPGIGDVGAYQASGTPFVFDTAGGSTNIANLKYVSSEIIVSVQGTATIDFQDATGAGVQTLSLGAGVYHFRVRTKAIRVQAVGGTTGVCVSLTGIDSDHLSPHDQDEYGVIV